MKKKLLILLVAFGITLVISYISYSGFFVKINRATVTIAKVIDGDTVELANGKKVRLLGIDAPEEGYYFYEESRNKLKQLVEGKEVTLEKDVSNTDSLGRLLRYIFVDSKFVNLEMVRLGFANVYIVPPDVKYSKELFQAEKEARENKLGLWSRSFYSNCINIINFHYNAKGDDNKNLNDEYVVFKNSCNFSVDMTNWTVKDAMTNIYIFPEFSLAKEATLTLRSGSGDNNTTNLYWNSKKAIWDNDGDTLYLRDEEGNLVLAYTYP